MMQPALDSEIRPVLHSRVRRQHRRQPDTVVLDELGLCRGTVRADVAVVNGLIHGFEIKSDRDTLRRLEGQVDVYGRVFDRATIVVGEKHLKEVTLMVPDWWGVLRVEERPGAKPKLCSVRRPRSNPQRDPRALVEMLWLEEAIALLESRGLDRGVRSKPRRVVWDRICEHFEIDEIGDAVRAHLKATADRRGSQP